MDRDKAKPKRYPTRGRARARVSTMEEVWEAEFCVAIARARTRAPVEKGSDDRLINLSYLLCPLWARLCMAYFKFFFSLTTHVRKERAKIILEIHAFIYMYMLIV